MWRVDFDPTGKRLVMRVRGRASMAEVRDLAEAHAKALAATGGADFRVLLDLRGLFPLQADALALLADIKRAAAELEGFQGIVVVTDNPTIAMQQIRTRVGDGANPTYELVTPDEDEAERFLQR